MNDLVLTSIRASLGRMTSAGLITPPTLSDAYELYILLLLLDAARSQGGLVEFRTVSGKLAYQLIFRSSPGQLFSDGREYTHASISFPNKPLLEAHIGVRVQGRSRVLHEADVLLLPESEADRSRREMTAPSSAKIMLGIECKYYAADLSLSLGREFLGLVSDLGSGLCFVANIRGSSLERLLQGRKRDWYTGAMPGVDAETRLNSFFQTLFRGYLAQ